MDLLTEGNAAKLYCLNWIEQYVISQPKAVGILDLGCGRALNFVKLLQKYPQIHYTGIEPSPAACAIAEKNVSGLNATILNGYAYDIYGKLIQEKVDIVVSFSVFEHVYRRSAYLQSAKACLKPDGFFLINYDAGHFIHRDNLREQAKNLIGPLLARLGQERYYQAFVREADFQNLIKQLDFKVVEAHSFNTQLKGIYKRLPAEHRTAFMAKWLELEEWLNSLNMPYEDRQAGSWLTRNFILKHSS